MSNLKQPNTANLDWGSLVQEAEPYTALASSADPVSGLIDVTYCGLKIKLSEVLKNQPASGVHGIAIFADTLLLDVARISTAGLLLVVRNIDTSALTDQTLWITPVAGGNVAQIVVGQVTGGEFKLGIAGIAATVSPPANNTAIVATTYIADGGKPLSPLAGGATERNLMGYTWNMNSLYASFTAAASLIDDPTNLLARTTAQSMLTWITTCMTCFAGSEALPSNYAQLYNQAAALLVTLNVAPNVTYVPILAQTYYSQHMSSIITVIRDYESKMNLLETQKDISQAVATVSATLQRVAADELAPLQTQLTSINLNAQSLFNDIVDLRGKFLSQNQRAHTSFEVLQLQIKIDSIYKQLAGELDMAMSAISLGFDTVKMASGDIDGLKDAIEVSVAGIKSLVDTIQAGITPDSEDLSTQASALLEGQAALMQTVLNSRLLWQQAMDNAKSGVLPLSLAAITIDPVTDWDNYIVTAEAAISTLNRQLESDSQAAADTYLASLKILAAYGKAIGTKYLAYVTQLVQATIVIAQIKAAKNVEAEWQQTLASTTSEVQKLAALKAVVQGRIQVVKRSLYIAWVNYAASYFYLNFRNPPRVLKMSMDSAELEVALIGVSEWVAQAVGNAPDGKHVKLPSNNAQIELDYEILPPKGQATTGDTAILDQTADGGWTLTFTLPLGSKQLDGVLPNQGQCAIWISQAAFFLDGVTPNSKGNVIATVSTSGSYQNGIGAADAQSFVTNGLTGDYAYHVQDHTVYSPWSIDSAVYMTPTPYTQWTMRLPPNSANPSTAKRLIVKLNIAYLSVS
jgi:hypothetical protein